MCDAFGNTNIEMRNQTLKQSLTLLANRTTLVLVRSRCACGQLTTQHVAIPPGANSVEETNQLVQLDTPKDKWTVTKHTRTYPTDAYGIIEFQGGGFINKTMVGLNH